MWAPSMQQTYSVIQVGFPSAEIKTSKIFTGFDKLGGEGHIN